MDIDDQVELENLLFFDRRCRVCGEVKNLLSDFYLIIPFTFIFRMLFVVETSSLNALQKPIITGVLTLIELIGIYYPVAVFLSQDYGYLGIFYALVIATVICGIAAVIINGLVLNSTWKRSLS